MVTTALLAPILTGAALVLLTAWLSRRAHRRSAPERPAPDASASTGIGAGLRSPRIWGALFVALVALGVAGASQVSAGGTVLLPLVAVLVVGYVIVGTYAAVRARGGGAASAVAAAGWIAGLLAVVAIAGRLMLG